MATVLGKYNPSEKHFLDFELANGNNDQNLYSNLDDNNNKGFCWKIQWKKQRFDGKTN